MIMTSFRYLGRCLGKRLAPVAIAGVVAASLPLPAGAQTPIKIGASMSVTGTYAKPGSYQKEGYDICIDELNGKGGLLGRKVGMTQIFDEAGTVIPVTVLEAGPCHVLQLRTTDRE